MDTVILGISRRGARWQRRIGIVLVLGFIMLAGQPRIPVTWGSIAPAQRDDSSYEEELQKGREFQIRRQYEAALKCFKRANELRDKKSPECILLMAQAYQGLEAYKTVIESCERVIELAAGDNSFRAQACNLKGIALQSMAAGKDPKKLREAEAAFREGLALNAGLPIIHYNLGFTLMQQGHDAEGIVELKEYVELQPRGSKREEARRLLENPRRARETFAPEFSITTAAGEFITLEDLRGKVVLLDFWATWCGPCVASVPYLRSLSKRFEKDSSFVMISISADSEADKWRAFIAENRMAWPQHLDRYRKVQQAFEVRSYPTYILIDPEGIIRFRTSGFGSDGMAKIEDAIHRQLKVVAKQPSA